MHSEKQTSEQPLLDFQKNSNYWTLKSLKSVVEIQAHYHLFIRTSDNQNSIFDGLNVFKQIVNYNTRGLVFLEGSIFDSALAGILLIIPVFPWQSMPLFALAIVF